MWPASAALLLFLGATGCHSASEVTAGPSPVKCGVRVQAQSTGFSATGGSGSVRISAPRECTWTAQADAGWVTIGGAASGQGDATLAFVVAANATTTARDAHITVKDQRVDISQQGAACAIRVSSNHESVGPEGGTRSVDVTTTGAECSWASASGASWITIASGESGKGNGVVSFRVAATTGPSRSSEVKIAGQVVRVSQSTGEPTGQPTDCSVSVTPSSTSVAASGGQGTIRVVTAATCAWSAVTAADWITIASGRSGTGNGEIRFSVPAHSGSGRTGVIHVGDQDVSVTQGANCSLSVSPAKLSVGAQASTSHVDVSGGAGCEWTAESRSDWVTVTSAGHGTGSGRVTFTISGNTGPERSGSVSVAGQAIPISQAGGCRYEVSRSAVALPGIGGNASVALTTDGACRWTASPSESWIDVSPASGTGAADLRISASTNLEEARKGTIAVGGREISVSQPSSCTVVLAPRSLDYNASGGAGAVLVVMTGACSWTASSRSPWIKLTFGTSGTGDGHVEFNVGTNTGTARTGHLTIAGTDFTVHQSAP